MDTIKSLFEAKLSAGAQYRPQHRQGQMYGSVRDWLNKYEISDADVEKAISIFKSSETFTRAKSIGLELVPAKKKTTGSMVFKFDGKYSRPNSFGYIIYPNAKIRSFASIDYYGSKSDGGIDPNMKQTPLKGPVPVANADDKVGSVVANLEAALNEVINKASKHLSKPKFNN